MLPWLFVETQKQGDRVVSWLVAAAIIAFVVAVATTFA